MQNRTLDQHHRPTIHNITVTKGLVIPTIRSRPYLSPKASSYLRYVLDPISHRRPRHTDDTFSTLSLTEGLVIPTIRSRPCLSPKASSYLQYVLDPITGCTVVQAPCYRRSLFPMGNSEIRPLTESKPRHWLR